MVINSEKWLAKDKEYLASVLPRCTDIVAESGVGSTLFDVNGKIFIDFTSGIATNSTGHCHPKVVQAIKDQAEELIHTSVVTHNIPTILLAEKLGTLVPYIEEPQVFFCNSGAEAVDGALKLARKVTGKGGIVAFQGAFHGRTLAATSLTTAKEKYQEGYDPLLPGIFVSPYGSELGTLEFYLSSHGSDTFGAVIVEPVLGEGGYIVPPIEWLQGLRELCDTFNTLLIFDEVQTGIGRTGEWFAAETFNVVPDVILFAKGIASGLPLGGIIASRSVMDKWPEGTHGSTFGGNPISCAAALATLHVVGPLLPRVRERGQQILSRLRAVTDYPVRGIGYMIGIEMPGKNYAEALKHMCEKDGLLIISCGTNDNVIRLMPALTINDSDLEQGVVIIERHLRKLV